MQTLTSTLSQTQIQYVNVTQNSMTTWMQTEIATATANVSPGVILIVIEMTVAMTRRSQRVNRAPRRPSCCRDRCVGIQT